MALVGGCDKGDERAPRRPQPEVPVTADTPPTPTAEVPLVPPPVDFPSELPLPPGATVVRAESTPDETGTAASATLVTTADTDDTLSWYVAALTDAGWEISERGPRSLHAIQGESYADITVTATDPDRTVIEARIWKAGR